MGRRPFWGGGENAELINTALKSQDGCSMTRCTADCNYPAPATTTATTPHTHFYLAIRMRISGSETVRLREGRGSSVMGAE